MKSIAPDNTHLDYFQRRRATRTGLTNRFGIRVRDGACISLAEVEDREAFTFGKQYPLPTKIETLPDVVRMVVEDHVLNYQDSDLIDLLTGKKSFQEALASPATDQVKRMVARAEWLK